MGLAECHPGNLRPSENQIFFLDGQVGEKEEEELEQVSQLFLALFLTTVSPKCLTYSIARLFCFSICIIFVFDLCLYLYSICVFRGKISRLCWSVNRGLLPRSAASAQ